MPSVMVSEILDTHSVLIYDNEETKMKLQSQFIKTVLAKNETVIYYTHGKPNIIEKQLNDLGIDSNYYISKDLLHIIKIPDFLKEPEGPKNSIDETMSQILKLKPPYHIIGRFFPDLTIKDSLNAEVSAEQMLQTNSANFDGSFLCSYSLDELSKISQEGKKEILSNHHNIIFGEKLTDAICVDSDLIF